MSEPWQTIIMMLMFAPMYAAIVYAFILTMKAAETNRKTEAMLDELDGYPRTPGTEHDHD